MVKIVTDKAALGVPTTYIPLVPLSPTMPKFDFSSLSEDIDIAVEALLSTPRAIAVAANQVGSHHSFFVAKYDLLMLSTATYKSLGTQATKNPDRFGSYIYLNPNFEVIGDLTTVDYLEGCLSHDKEVVVPRHKTILFKGYEVKLLSEEKAEVIQFSKILKNLSAQIVQHEVGHLFGKGIWQHEK